MAVQWIGSLSDAELLDYLPQLVQVRGLAVLMPPPPSLSPSALRSQHPRKVVSADFRCLIKPHVCCLLNRP